MRTLAPPVTPFSRKNPTYTQEQLNAIKLTYTEGEKLALIQSFGPTDDYFKFDLSPEGSHTNAGNGLGGQAFLAAVSNYPVLMNTGISIAIGFLNPCGLDSIHLHNRATEVVTLVKGVSLKTGFVLEDGFGWYPLAVELTQSTDVLQTCPSLPRLDCTKPPSALWARSITSSTTIANLLFSLLRSPVRTLVFHAQLKTSSSIRKTSLMLISRIQTGWTMSTPPTSGLPCQLRSHRVPSNATRGAV